MSSKLFVGGFAVGILFLALGLFVAPMVTASNTDATNTVSVASGSTGEIQQNLEIEVNSVNSTDANVTLRNTRTFDTNTTVIGDGNSTDLQLSGETVTVQYTSFTGDAVLTVTYPPTFAYDDNVSVFYDNLGLLLTLIGFAIAVFSALFGVLAARD